MTREEFLKEKIKQEFSSIRAFSEFIQIPNSTITSILKDVDRGTFANLKRICAGLNMTVDDLEMAGTTKKPIKLNSHEYPYVPYGIAAGSLETVEAINCFDKIEVPDVFLGRYAGSRNILLLKVNGQSMNRIIEDGAHIAVRFDIEISNLNNGDIVVISNQGNYTVKRFYNDTNNRRFIFRPDSTNPVFTDIIFNYDECDDLQLVGKVVMYNIVL